MTWAKKGQGEYQKVIEILGGGDEGEKNFKSIIETGDLQLGSLNNVWPDLFEYYMVQMPYGTAKARTGDPEDWIYDRLCRLKQTFLDATEEKIILRGW